jgi:anti-anti-sigma regulatory factor
MAVSEVMVSEENGVIIVIAPNYFNEACALKINRASDTFLPQGKHRVVIDFSNCELINSPGVAGMLDFMLKVVEDYRGLLIFCGLNNLLTEVFELASILDKVRITTSLTEGKTLALKSSPTHKS